MRLPLAAGLLVLPLLAFKAALAWSPSTIIKTTRLRIHLRIPLPRCRDRHRHFDAGVNAVLYGPDGVLGAKTPD